MKLLSALVVLTLLSCKSDAKKNSPELTEIVNLEVYDFSGIEPYLHQEGSKVYIVNFWATWCAPCVKELPYFEAIQQTYKKDVEVILVSLDFPHQYETQLKPFVRKHQLKSKLLVLDDPNMNSWIPKVSSNWDGALPVTLIYNSTRRSFYNRTFTYGDLETELKTFFTTK